MGPFSPILPTPVDQPPDGAERPEPRRYEFEPGWNLPSGQPGSEGLKLAPFSTLRTIADIYSVARACIQLRKAEIRGLDWDIIPSHEAAKAYHGDRSAMKDFAERRAQLVKFFRHPDPDYFSFGTWLDAVLEEIFVYDALSILIRPKWGRGMGKGLLGSDLDSLQLLSGPTIRPLIDLHGSIPRPPAPAYQQFLFGVPRTDLMTMITRRDMDEGGLNDKALREFRGDQLLYLPMVPRRWTPYGFGPVERALIPIMSGLQKQAYQMAYYREGTVPEVYISPGDANMTPNQLRELQDALNAFAGDPAWKHKIIVLPPGSKTEPMKTKEIADQFDEIVMTQVTMAFDINPMEIGLLPRVSTVASPFAAREMAQASRTIHERTSTKPLLKFIADLFDNIMHRVVGQDDMKFTFEGLQEEDEANQATQMLAQQVQFGIRSVDEARDELELEPWGLPETSGPVFFGPQGPLPFGQVAISEAGGDPASSGSMNQTESATESSETLNNVPPNPNSGPNPGQGGDLGPELTPAHMAAQAFMNQPSSHPAGGTPSDNAKKSRTLLDKTTLTDRNRKHARAQFAELESLARHIHNGRDPDTWEIRNIPRYAPALLQAEILEGASRSEAVEKIARIIEGDVDYAWNCDLQAA